MSGPRIAYAGMTHLGLCSGVAAAELGFDVLLFDPDAERIAALERDELPVSEPDLEELFARNQARLRYSAKPQDLEACALVYVAADVPTDDAGRSDLEGIDRLLELVDAHATSATPRVVLSQVPPGFTRARRRTEDPLYYQVETLIFGRAMERALRPERFIVGCEDPHEALPEIYAGFLSRFGCEILPMRYESAEFAKISINACLVASISAANTLAGICERIGARWDEIAPALRLDARIGPKAYLDPGLGIAGGNLERDLATICRLAESTGSDASVVEAWLANSAYRRDWALRTVHEQVLKRIDEPRLAIWGLAYKRDTASTKNSPSLALIRALPHLRLRAWDPLVPATAAAAANVEQADSALDACGDADALLVMTPWPVFSDVDTRELARALRGTSVIDPYRCLDESRCLEAGLAYHALGAEAAATPED